MWGLDGAYASDPTAGGIMGTGELPMRSRSLAVDRSPVDATLRRHAELGRRLIVVIARATPQQQTDAFLRAIAVVRRTAPRPRRVGRFAAGQVPCREAMSAVLAVRISSSASTVHLRLPTSADALGWDVGDLDVR